MGTGNDHIPVVQGYAVPSNEPMPSSYHQAIPSQWSQADVPSYPYSTNTNGFKGEPQPKRFNDVFFAIAFYLHLSVIIYLFVATLVNGNAAAQGDGTSGGDISGIVYCATVSGVLAAGLSTISVGFMMQFPAFLIKAALIVTVGLSLALGILGLMSGQILMGVIGLLSFAFGCCYACAAWSRIPFAAANLKTALTAVKANLGLLVVAFFMLAVALVWSIVWSTATSGMYSTYGSGIVFLFLVSFYWTHQVLQNTIHVTTAGVIGTWWFVPNEASSCCSQAIGDSFCRATTLSFGSICFGSLLVAIVQALRHLHHMLHQNEDFNILVCIIDCILACLQDLVEYLNKWAYIYVGLYGYSYLEAGKNVFTLFENKGWSTIISDDLVDRALFLMSLGIGLCTGVVGIITASMEKDSLSNLGISNPGPIGFLIGFFVGLIMASIMLGVVGSAVDTVIVCFAESPAEFDQNHSGLSSEMRYAWREAWPELSHTF